MRLECFGKNVPTRSSLFSMDWWLREMTCYMSDPSQRHIFICWIREEPRAKLGFPPVSLKLVQNHKDTEPESILQVHWRFLEFLSCFRIVSSALWCVYSASRCNFSFCIQRTRHRWVINSSSQFSSVHFSCSLVSDSLQPHGLQHTRPPCPSPTPRVYSNSCPLSRWCHPAISSSVIPSPPAFNLSQRHSLFKWVRSSHQVAKGLEFSFSNSPSNEYSGLICFRMDWLDLPAVQGTLKSLLQHHSSRASVLWHSAFFIVQLSYP